MTTAKTKPITVYLSKQLFEILSDHARLESQKAFRRVSISELTVRAIANLFAKGDADSIL